MLAVCLLLYWLIKINMAKEKEEIIFCFYSLLQINASGQIWFQLKDMVWDYTENISSGPLYPCSHPRD